MKEGLADPLQAYEAGLMEERETLAAYISSADKAAIDALKAYKDFTLAYTEVKDQLGKRLLLDRCLWLSERKYLHSVALSTAFLKELALFVLKYIKKYIELENFRLTTIRKAMRQFISIQEAFFVPIELAANSLISLDSVGVLTPISVFSTLFHAEEVAILREFSENEDIEEAIKAWNLVIPSSLPLIIVQNKVYYQESLPTSTKVKGIITADGFLHVFDRARDRQLVEPVFTLQLTPNRLDLELNQQALMVKLRVRMSRFRNFLKQPMVVVLRLTNERKYECWRAVLTHFLPIYTSVDNIVTHRD